ncbi:MAG: Hsp20/alpha crystallin family protein [Deltaproteobacteria bacterium]|nr:Hsp20/alpha crystallin family protein [Deltaproteobacteria bacterium]
MTTQEIAPKEKQEATEAQQTKAGRYYVPDVDIREDEQALWLWADIPGVKQENIAVDLDHGVLTLRGDVTLEDYESLTPVYTEYNVGNFVRRFTLPSTSHLDVEGISARVSNGVLEVRLPKSEKARQRRIPVKAA